MKYQKNKNMKNLKKIISSVPVVIMPFIMIMLTSILIVSVLLIENQNIIYVMYFCAACIPVAIPASTLALVLSFEKKRRTRLLVRMGLTALIGVAMYLVLFIFSQYVQHTLLFVSCIFLIYFLLDFQKQAKTYLRIKNKLEKVLRNKKVLESLLQEKCSRSMLERATKKQNTLLWQTFIEERNKRDIKEYHLFPTGKEPLWKTLLKK